MISYPSPWAQRVGATLASAGIAGVVPLRLVWEFMEGKVTQANGYGRRVSVSLAKAIAEGRKRLEELECRAQELSHGL
jgi:hypothetical protein